MPGLYGVSGGVNRLPKQWNAPTSGMNRKLKELWGRDGSGVNRKIFSGAIIWTYDITLTQDNPSYSAQAGNSDQESVYMSVGNYHSNAKCDITYKFESSFYMRPGQTLSIKFYNYYSSGSYGYVYVNGTQIFNKSNSYDNSTSTTIYTFESDTIISSIQTSLRTNGGKDPTHSNNGYLSVMVNSDNGSFLLNNTHTSNNQ